MTCEIVRVSPKVVYERKGHDSHGQQQDGQAPEIPTDALAVTQNEISSESDRDERD
jgi:hypothetical protein